MGCASNGVISPFSADEDQILQLIGIKRIIIVAKLIHIAVYIAVVRVILAVCSRRNEQGFTSQIFGMILDILCYFFGIPAEFFKVVVPHAYFCTVLTSHKVVGIHHVAINDIDGAFRLGCINNAVCQILKRRNKRKSSRKRGIETISRINFFARTGSYRIGSYQPLCDGKFSIVVLPFLFLFVI